MAKPQIENGYIPIATEIAEVLMQVQLSGNQNRLLWAIWRKTWGFRKKEDWISNSQLCMMTGLIKQHVNRALQELKKMKIVTKNGYKYSFNKNYDEWVTKNGDKQQIKVINFDKKVINFGSPVINFDAHNNRYNNKQYTIKGKCKECYGINGNHAAWHEAAIKNS